MKRSDKKGQVTIFIIIAVLIVVLAVLVYLFFPQIKSTLGFESKNPGAYMQSCMEDKMEEALAILAPQGGSIAPQHYLLYGGEKLEYLCYTNEYYKTCVVQQPMLLQHIESEIKEYVEDTADECLDNMEKTFEAKGYNVVLNDKEFQIELLPKRVVANFDVSLTLTKAGVSSDMDSISVIVNNNLYELVSIANSILEWEASEGDSETTVYMNYYHDLKVEKKKQSDGSTAYILTDRNRPQNKFQFASRSLAWPPGY